MLTINKIQSLAIALFSALPRHGKNKKNRAVGTLLSSQKIIYNKLARRCARLCIAGLRVGLGVGGLWQ